MNELELAIREKVHSDVSTLAKEMDKSTMSLLNKKVIYIAGAYRADTEWGIFCNIRKAEKKALELWRQGWVVLCPHKNTEHFQGACDNRVWLDGCLEFVRRSDAIYMLNNWTTSEGSKEELKLAKELGLEIYFEEFLIGYA